MFKLEFKIEDSHQFSDSIMHHCIHCSKHVINKELAYVTSAIKVICGNCLLSVNETGDVGLNCALFNRSNIFCFICRKSGSDIKLSKIYTTSLICVKFSNIIENRKNEKQSVEKKQLQQTFRTIKVD